MTPISQLTIPKRKTGKTPSEEAAFDWQQLYSIGLEHIQRLARRIWTDYNVHDPGITTLELLCYALTDLSYRASFPIEDLLASASDNAGNMQKQFFSGRQILPNRPLTLLDYRKLLIDLEGVRNAWLEPSPSVYYADMVKGELLRENPGLPGIKEVHIAGLYRVIIEYESDRVDEQKEARQRVEQRLHENRNLCEDFVSIGKAGEQRFNLCCELELAPEANVAKVKAEILFQAEQYMSPAVRNYTLSEMLERKKADGTTYTTEEIFDGPLLDCGFIDDEELARADLRTQIRLSDIINIIMDIEGVRAVRGILVNAIETLPDGKPIQPENIWEVPVAAGCKAVLNKESSRLVFYKRNMPVVPKNDDVNNEYEKLAAAALAKAETASVYDFDIPLGEYRKPDSYYSFQNHFPAVYGISEAGLSRPADEKRQALALQLKAYLLFFDQVMANYLAQLSHVKELFSTDPDLRRSYFHQVVDSFVDYQKIYKVTDNLEKATGNLEKATGSLGKATGSPEKATGSPEKATGSPEKATGSEEKATGSEESEIKAEIMEYLKGVDDKSASIDRRNRFLDHLIARFAERFNDFASIMYSAFESGPGSMIAYKCRFLRDYPVISSDRSLAYNYSLKDESALWNTKNVSGLEKRLARLLGIRNYKRKDLSDITYDIYAEIDATPDDEFRFRLRARDTGKIIMSSSSHYTTPELAKEEMSRAIQFALLPAGYERKITGNGKFYFNVIDDTGEVIARRIEYFDTEKERDDAIDELMEYLRVNYDNEGMYIIENILLLPEQADDPFLPICPASTSAPCMQEDPYSYRLHIILPAEAVRFSNMDFRRFAEEVIREETPAHILPKICWISKGDMAVLEARYRDWIDLKAGAKTSERQNKLAEFVKVLFAVRNVYKQTYLHECGDTEEKDKFILGQTALGSMDDSES
jgi:hypothetical protein